MSDFKLLAGSDPASNPVGVMTEGIGKPLRKVELSTDGGEVSIVIETAILATSLVDQDPVGLGVPLQVTLGDAQVTDYFSLDAAGALTCLQTDEYTLRAKFTVGRENSSGESEIYTRGLINGVAVGDTSHTIIDNSRTEIPFDFEANGMLTVGDVVTFEIVRNNAGDNSGGLRVGVPTVTGWNTSPSVRLLISRFAAVST